MTSALQLLPALDYPTAALDAHEASILEEKMRGRGVRDIARQLNIPVAEVVAVLSRPHVVREHAACLSEQRADTVNLIEVGLNTAIKRLVEITADPLSDAPTVLKCAKAICDMKQLGLEQERMGLEFALKRDELMRKAALRQMSMPNIMESAEQVLVWDAQTRAIISGPTPNTVSILNSPAINKSAASADGTPEGFFSEMNRDDP